MDYDFGWGAVVNFTKRRPSKDQKPEDIIPQQSFVLDVLLLVADGASNGTKTHQDLPQGVRPPLEGENAKMEVVPVLLSCIESIGHIRIFLPNDLKSADQRNTVRKSLDEVKRRFPDGIAVLDPIENMGITDDSFKKLMRVCGAKVPPNTVLNPNNMSYRKSKCSSPVYCPIHSTTLLDYLISTTSTPERWTCLRSSKLSRNRLLLRSRSCSLMS